MMDFIDSEKLSSSDQSVCYCSMLGVGPAWTLYSLPSEAQLTVEGSS